MYSWSDLTKMHCHCTQTYKMQAVGHPLQQQQVKACPISEPLPSSLHAMTLSEGVSRLVWLGSTRPDSSNQWLAHQQLTNHIIVRFICSTDPKCGPVPEGLRRLSRLKSSSRVKMRYAHPHARRYKDKRSSPCSEGSSLKYLHQGHVHTAHGPGCSAPGSTASCCWCALGVCHSESEPQPKDQMDVGAAAKGCSLHTTSGLVVVVSLLHGKQ